MSSSSSPPKSLIAALSLSPHPEGGFYGRTHTSSRSVPNPFSDDGTTRLESTSIYYLLTRASPTGHFHRNKALIYHFHHRGRGRYRLIHPSGEVEEFVVGRDVEGGERIMWVVDGGVWKCSMLEPGEEELLISEVVVPGFEFCDQEFMDWGRLVELVGSERAGEWREFLKEGLRGE